MSVDESYVQDLVPVQVRRSPRLVAAQAAALDPDASCDLLRELALEKVSVQRLVAVNPGCPPEVLRFLAASVHVPVRAGVAGNAACPGDVLVELASERSCTIRQAAAGNPSTPLSALHALRLGAGGMVLEALAGNPSCPLEVLVEVPAAAIPARLLTDRLSGHEDWAEVAGLHVGWEGTLGELLEAAGLVKGKPSRPDGR